MLKRIYYRALHNIIPFLRGSLYVAQKKEDRTLDYATYVLQWKCGSVDRSHGELGIQ